MTTVGQVEKKTQARIVALLRDRLHYSYLGNWADRAGNANIESGRLSAWLATEELQRTQPSSTTVPCPVRKAAFTVVPG